MSIFSRVTFLALWVFVFSIPSEKAINIPNFGTLTKLIGFIVMGLGLLAVAVERRMRRPSPFHIALTGFMLWSALTMQWTISTDWTMLRLNTYSQLFVMILLVWQFAPGEKQVHALLAAYVVGTLVPFMDTMRVYLAGGNTQYYQRYSATGAEPNDLSVMLALSVPMSYYLWLHYRAARRGEGIGALHWFFPLQIVMVVANVLLAASRGGTITITLSLTVVIWTGFAIPSRMRWALLGIASVGALGIAMLVPESSWKRLSTLGEEVREGSLNGRTRIWNEGWNAFTKHAVVGIGSGAFPDSTLDYFGHPRTPKEFTPVAHNTFFSVLVETGVVGLGLFLVMLAQLVRAAWAMPRLQRCVWLTGMAVWALGVSSLSWEDRKPMWLMFALLAAHSGALLTHRRGRMESLEGLPFASNPLGWKEAVS